MIMSFVVRVKPNSLSLGADEEDAAVGDEGAGADGRDVIWCRSTELLQCAACKIEIETKGRLVVGDTS